MSDQERRPSAARRLLPLGLLVAAAALFVGGGGYRYLSFAALAAHRDFLCALVAKSACISGFVFIAAYAGLTALSVPGAVVLTIAGGFLFGTWLGLLYAVVGATLGATAIFLAARAGLHGVAERAGPRVRRLEAGFRDNAFNYLLVLRLVPIFPFWLVNLVAALAGMTLSSYVLGTLLGIIPGTFVYASLGNGFGKIIAAGHAPDPGVLFRPSVLVPIVGLAVLAVLPVLYKIWRRRHRKQPA